MAAAEAKVNTPKPEILAVVAADTKVRAALREHMRANPNMTELVTNLLSFPARYVQEHYAHLRDADAFTTGSR